MTSPRVDALLAWCTSNGIVLSDDIALIDDASTGALSVHSRARPIPPCSSLVSIPKSAVLSTRTCALAPHIPHAPYGPDAHLALALALHSELLLGRASRFSGYLQALPAPSWPGIALFWGAPASASDGPGLAPADGREARAWLQGTEAWALLSAQAPSVSAIRAYYSATALPLLRAHLPAATARASTCAGFEHASALVSSRAFSVDAFHGLAMVPIADAFNHAADHDVQLETEYDVCPLCGSLAECPHDADASTLQANSPQNAPDTCEMRARAPIAPHREVFNTYGAGLSSAALLVRYGFALSAHEHDVLTFAPSDLPLPADFNDPEADLNGMEAADWGGSALVAGVCGGARCITADGALSPALWAALVPRGHDVRRLARVQVALERLREGEGEAGGDAELVLEDTDAAGLRAVARGVDAVCAARVGRLLAGPGLAVAEGGSPSAAVGAYLDGLDAGMVRTRTAAAYVLGEVCVVEACRAGWADFARYLDGLGHGPAM